MDAPITSLGTPAGLDYDAALKRVMGLADFERSTTSPAHSGFHLERMGLLMDRLGNPHLGIPTVHVAGTDGKGSTAAMVTSILTAAGYKTGLYTSPHLHTVAERIRLGLRPIARSDFAALVDIAWPAVEWVGVHGGYGGVSFFELLTSMAFLHFRQVEADFQVIEVGMGGRLDATNVVRPEVCIITPISLDHVATLGNTVALIAAEKAGIIKRDVPVVMAVQPEEASAVLLETAGARHSPVVEVARAYSWRPRHADRSGQTFHVVGRHGGYDLWMPLLGVHQIENCCTAIATAEALIDRGFSLVTGSIAQGIRRVTWPARLQVLSCDGKQVAVDGAHNPASMRRLVQAVRSHFGFERAIIVFGAIGGHSAHGMLVELAVLDPSVLAVRSRHPKSAESALVADVARRVGLTVTIESEHVGEAVLRALDMAGPNDLVLGTGSLSVAAEVIEELEGMDPELYPNIRRPAPQPGLSIGGV